MTTRTRQNEMHKMSLWLLHTCSIVTTRYKYHRTGTSLRHSYASAAWDWNVCAWERLLLMALVFNFILNTNTAGSVNSVLSIFMWKLFDEWDLGEVGFWSGINLFKFNTFTRHLPDICALEANHFKDTKCTVIAALKVYCISIFIDAIDDTWCRVRHLPTRNKFTLRTSAG